MNKMFGGSIILWSALTLAPAVGLADTGKAAHVGRSYVAHSHVAPCNTVRREPKFKRWTQTRGQQVAVPELDPGAAGQALALLFGGTAVLLDRSRRRNRV